MLDAEVGELAGHVEGYGLLEVESSDSRIAVGLPRPVARGRTEPLGRNGQPMRVVGLDEAVRPGPPGAVERAAEVEEDRPQTGHAPT